MFSNLFNKKITFSTDLSKMMLKGNIKEIIIRFEHIIDPKYNKEILIHFHEYQRKYYKDLYFDSLGNLREEIQYKFINQIESHKFYSYNNRNELISKIFKYGNILNSFEYHFLYMPKSIIISQKINEEKDNDFSKTLFFKNKSLIKEVHEETSLGQKLVSFKRYDDGKLVEINKNLHSRIFHYDDSGNITRIDYCKNGVSNYCYSTKNYLYNEYNRLIKCSVFDEDVTDGRTLRETYKYESDIKGNWIHKKITNTKDKSILNIFRNIQYYD